MICGDSILHFRYFCAISLHVSQYMYDQCSYLSSSIPNRKVSSITIITDDSLQVYAHVRGTRLHSECALLQSALGMHDEALHTYVYAMFDDENDNAGAAAEGATNSSSGSFDWVIIDDYRGSVFSGGDSGNNGGSNRSESDGPWSVSKGNSSDVSRDSGGGGGDVPFPCELAATAYCFSFVRHSAGFYAIEREKRRRWLQRYIRRRRRLPSVCVADNAVDDKSGGGVAGLSLSSFVPTDTAVATTTAAAVATASPSTAQILRELSSIGKDDISDTVAAPAAVVAVATATCSDSSDLGDELDEDNEAGDDAAVCDGGDAVLAARLFIQLLRLFLSDDYALRWTLSSRAAVASRAALPHSTRRYRSALRLLNLYHPFFSQ